MAFQHPGVFIQEVPSGVQPIEGVSTSTAAFIGKTEMGPLGKPQLVTSPAEFQAAYGGYFADNYVAQSIFQFFNNSGKKTYVVRVAGSGAVAATIALKDRKTTSSQTLTVAASSEGVWGNRLDVAVSDGPDDPDNEFTLTVYRDRSDLNPPLPTQLLERFQNLSIDPAAPDFVDGIVASRLQYISTTTASANMASAVAGTSRGGVLPVGNGAEVLKLGTANGETEAVGTTTPTAGTSRSGDTPSTSPPADARKLMVNLDGDGPLTPTSATGMVLTDRAQGPAGGGGRFLLPRGHYEPTQFAGALIGSFDGFDHAFVIGSASSFVVPENASTLELAVNWELSRYAAIAGIYDLALSEQELPPVPTHTIQQGDATGHIPPTLPHWNVLTSLNLYSYILSRVTNPDGPVRSETLQPIGTAHFSVYDSHVH